MAPGGHTPWRGVVGGVSFRPNPLAPFPAREGGNFSPPRFGEGPGERLTRHEWGPKRWRTLSQRGWANGGVQGGGAPMAGGCGGCAPFNAD
jgi:hypothetical protein